MLNSSDNGLRQIIDIYGASYARWSKAPGVQQYQGWAGTHAAQVYARGAVSGIVGVSVDIGNDLWHLIECFLERRLSREGDRIHVGCRD